MSGLCAALAGADSLVANGHLRRREQRRASPRSSSTATRSAPSAATCARTRSTRSTALIDDIKEVGIGGHYLGRRSTRTFYRAGEVWRPDVFQREGFEDCAGTSLVERALGARGRAARDPRGPAARPTPPSARSPRSSPGRRRMSAGGMSRALDQLPQRRERDFVHEQVVRVLEEVGIGYNTPAAIELLEEAGASGRPRAPHGQAAVGARRALPGDGAAARCCSPGATRRTTWSSATGRSRSAPTAPAPTCSTT